MFTDARDLILHDIKGFATDVVAGKLEPDWPRIIRMVNEAYRGDLSAPEPEKETCDGDGWRCDIDRQNHGNHNHVQCPGCSMCKKEGQQ